MQMVPTFLIALDVGFVKTKGNDDTKTGRGPRFAFGAVASEQIKISESVRRADDRAFQGGRVRTVRRFHFQ